MFGSRGPTLSIRATEAIDRPSEVLANRSRSSQNELLGLLVFGRIYTRLANQCLGMGSCRLTSDGCWLRQLSQTMD